MSTSRNAKRTGVLIAWMIVTTAVTTSALASVSVRAYASMSPGDRKNGTAIFPGYHNGFVTGPEEEVAQYENHNLIINGYSWKKGGFTNTRMDDCSRSLTLKNTTDNSMSCTTVWDIGCNDGDTIEGKAVVDATLKDPTTGPADSDSDDGGGWKSVTCTIAEDSPAGGGVNPPPGATPIVINLEPGRFELTGLEDPVVFDIDADGKMETVSWTTASFRGGLLALDRNGNGRIDDGRELFGDAAYQLASDDPNGFRALAIYDAAEVAGNRDGVISAADAIFPKLRVWIDSNHDGVSQSSELTSLTENGISAIELDYVVANRRDRHGNVFLWTSMVHFDDHRRFAASDVVLLTAP